jgi:hypothetical protein
MRELKGFAVKPVSRIYAARRTWGKESASCQEETVRVLRGQVPGERDRVVVAVEEVKGE